MTSLLLVVNITMIILTIVYIGKNILVHYKLSDSGIKNGCVAILLCVIVWCAGQGALIGTTVSQAEDALKYMSLQEEISKDEIEDLKIVIASDKKTVEVFTSIAVISLGGLELLRRNIIKERNSRPTTSTWDLSKYK